MEYTPNSWLENGTLLIINQQSNISNTEVLKSNICDYNDGYILVRGDITATAAPATPVSFKNCASCNKCITKNDEAIHDAEDLDFVRPMYNIIEYSSNYSQTTGIL